MTTDLRGTQDDILRDEPFTVKEASGAFTNCECSWCRQRRLRDDDRITYTAGDLADAYHHGYWDGARAIVRASKRGRD